MKISPGQIDAPWAQQDIFFGISCYKQVVMHVPKLLSQFLYRKHPMEEKRAEFPSEARVRQSWSGNPNLIWIWSSFKILDSDWIRISNYLNFAKPCQKQCLITSPSIKTILTTCVVEKHFKVLIFWRLFVFNGLPLASSLVTMMLLKMVKITKRT